MARSGFHGASRTKISKINLLYILSYDQRTFTGYSPASHWPADSHGVSALRKGSVGLRGFTVGEKAWVVHVLVGVAVFCEAHVLARGRRERKREQDRENLSGIFRTRCRLVKHFRACYVGELVGTGGHDERSGAGESRGRGSVSVSDGLSQKERDRNCCVGRANLRLRVFFIAVLVTDIVGVGVAVAVAVAVLVGLVL